MPQLDQTLYDRIRSLEMEPDEQLHYRELAAHLRARITHALSQEQGGPLAENAVQLPGKLCLDLNQGFPVIRKAIRPKPNPNLEAGKPGFLCQKA